MGLCVRYGHGAVEPLKRAGIVLLAALLSACAGPSGTVPIDDRGRGGMRAHTVTTGYHTVQRGETLYQIAFRYGWDWKTLASNNNLRAPYTIYPGQRISLARRSNTRIASSPVVSTPRVTALASTRSQTSSVRSTPAETNPIRSSTSVSASPAPTSTTPASSSASSSSAGPISASGWGWPARGQLLARFQSNGSLNKGIDIAGQLGEPVKAAADGAVVYAGRGLIGYGDMIIIKHDETFLSAYAHNSRLLVKEGDQVKVGQVIAEMGSSGTDRVKLHFEIRRKGQPVDPLAYLPRS
ncbi:peptidoglycan DD-metalloendopeptidase family protein [Halopseudomonas sp.]|uniref:peptidoglycan DD-metalloendopeptidase family protein n=1 Tax=Halopseudomonas sp. TaxID=2901191 RepID=UPI00311DD9C5